MWKAVPGDHMATYEKSSVVKGHHIYKFVWTPVIGEELQTKLEQNNEHDRHAVAVMRDAGRAVMRDEYEQRFAAMVIVPRGFRPRRL